MNRTVSNIARALSQLQISQGPNALQSAERVNCRLSASPTLRASHSDDYSRNLLFRDIGQLPTTSHSAIARTAASTIPVTNNSSTFAGGNSNGSGLIWSVNGMAKPLMENYSMKLPTANNINSTVYTFPTLHKDPLCVPTVSWKKLLEINEFGITEKVIIEDPHTSSNTPMYADIRVLTIRRRKMNKHKRRKREKRDRFQMMKYHREKKAKSEHLFQQRMREKIEKLHAFSAEAYVRDVIRRAKRDWRTELVPSGKKKHPHWSTLMSLEELYGLKPGDYIDKRYGIPNDEDKARIQELKTKYYKEFLGEGNNSDAEAPKIDEKTKK